MFLTRLAAVSTVLPITPVPRACAAGFCQPVEIEMHLDVAATRSLAAFIKAASKA
jgi:hypothetical protein